jgi:hypothetical protein
MVPRVVTEMGAMVALRVSRGAGTRGVSARMEIPSLWVAKGATPTPATVKSTGASLPRGGLSNRRGKKPRGERRRRPGRRVTNSRELEVVHPVLRGRDLQRERGRLAGMQPMPNPRAIPRAAAGPGHRRTWSVSSVVVRGTSRLLALST